MKLHEYQAKQLFALYNLPIPVGYTCNTPSEAEKLASKINSKSWMVKCQIHAGSRSKSGGVKLAKSKKEIRDFAEQWLGKRLITYQTNKFGQPVNCILIEEAIDIIREIYLSIIIDHSRCKVIFIVSDQGGVEIEKLSKKTPHLIHKIKLDPLVGPQLNQGKKLALKLNLDNTQVMQFNNIFMNLATLFLERDLIMVEVNPLAITKAGSFICLDGKIIVDDNALFRQPELSKMYDYSQMDEIEARANMWGLKYVTLDGDIGCIVNGAGLAMGTMDTIKMYGGNPANFLDIGGSATVERVKEAFKLILSNPKIKAILINIFGGILQCDVVANGVIDVASEVNIKVPIVIRLDGNNASVGIQLLVDSKLKIIISKTLEKAVQQVVNIAASNVNTSQ